MHVSVPLQYRNLKFILHCRLLFLGMERISSETDMTCFIFVYHLHCLYNIDIITIYIYIINIVHTIMFCRAVFDCLVDQVGRNDTESLRCQFSFDWHYIPIGCIPPANTTLVSSKS